MHITLTRTADAPLTLERSGNILTFNGAAFDFAPLPDGATLPLYSVACPWINGPVTRSAAGVLTVPVIAPYAGGDLPEALWHTAPIIDPPDGPIELPAYDLETADAD